jgi:hypothetical protein
LQQAPGPFRNATPDRDSSTARNINKTLRSFAPEVCLIVMFLLPGEESN